MMELQRYENNARGPGRDFNSDVIKHFATFNSKLITISSPDQLSVAVKEWPQPQDWLVSTVYDKYCFLKTPNTSANIGQI